MNMPVLPVTSSSPSPADNPARGADTAAATDAPAFSNVLSQQREGTARPADSHRSESRPAESRRLEEADRHAAPDAAERHDPLGPDETLALILDSAALPLMRPVSSVVQTATPHTGQAVHTDPRTARLPIDVSGKTLTDSYDATQDARASGEDDVIEITRMPRTDMAATVPAARAPLHTDASTSVSPRETARTRSVSASIQAPQFHQRNTDPMPDVDRLHADQAAAGASAVESSMHIRTAHGLEAPAPDGAAMASASAPVGASLLPATTSMPAAAPVAVPTPLSNPQWPQDFSRQILHLTQNLAGAGNTVQMHVNPPELGPIHITLHVGDSIAQASFVSPHASVRQALENALPHLEQQLAQAGLSLGQADVGDQQPGQQAQGQAPSARNGDSTFSLDGQVADTATSTATTIPRTVTRPDALVDTFA